MVPRETRPFLPLTASSFHFNSLTSCRNKANNQILYVDNDQKWNTDCVSLECLDGSVLSQFTDMNAHVCATRGKRVVALPVHIQSWGWGEQGHHKYTLAYAHRLKDSEEKVPAPYLNGRGTVVWLLPCERPIWWLSGETYRKVKRRPSKDNMSTNSGYLGNPWAFKLPGFFSSPIYYIQNMAQYVQSKVVLRQQASGPLPCLLRHSGWNCPFYSTSEQRWDLCVVQVCWPGFLLKSTKRTSWASPL